MNKEEHEEFVKKYKEGKIIISVEVAMARKILTEIDYIPLAIMYLIIYGLLFGCCIFSFFVLKFGGIVYSMLFPIVCLLFMGDASLPNAPYHCNNIVWLGIACTILSFFNFSINITCLIFFSFAELYLIYYLYKFVGKTIIDKFILKDVNLFNSLFDEGAFFIKTL